MCNTASQIIDLGKGTRKHLHLAPWSGHYLLQRVCMFATKAHGCVPSHQHIYHTVLKTGGFLRHHPHVRNTRDTVYVIHFAIFTNAYQARTPSKGKLHGQCPSGNILYEKKLIRSHLRISADTTSLHLLTETCCSVDKVGNVCIHNEHSIGALSVR